MTRKEQLEKFQQDKALERVTALYTACNLLMHCSMAFFADAENLLDIYGLKIFDVKKAISDLYKDYERFSYTFSQFYKDGGRKIFTEDYDKCVKDAYLYCGIPMEWRQGQPTPIGYIGVQNMVSEGKCSRGKTIERFIGRDLKGKVYITTSMDANQGYSLPSHWFRNIKKGECVKVRIEPKIKF